MAYGKCRDCKLVVEMEAISCPDCHTQLPALDERTCKWRTDGPMWLGLTIGALVVGCILGSLGPFFARSYGTPNLMYLSVILGTVFLAVFCLVEPIAKQTTEKTEDQVQHATNIAGWSGVASCVVVYFLATFVWGRDVMASLACGICGALLGGFLGLLPAGYWLGTRYPSPKGTSWRSLGIELHDQLREIEKKEAFLIQTREQLEGAPVNQSTRQRLSLLDDAAARLTATRDRYTARKWQLDLLRWHAGLAPHLAASPPQTPADCERNKSELSDLQGHGGLLQWRWQQTDTAASDAGRQVLAQLEQLLGVLGKLQQASFDQQIVLARRMAGSVEANEPDFTRLYSQLREFAGSVIKSEIRVEEAEAAIGAEYAELVARVEVEGWVSDGETSLEASTIPTTLRS